MAVYRRSLSRALTRLANLESNRVRRHIGLVGSSAKAPGGSYDETDVTENAIGAPNIALSSTNLGLNLLGHDFLTHATNEALSQQKVIRNEGVVVAAENRTQRLIEESEATDAETKEAEVEELPAPAMG